MSDDNDSNATEDDLDAAVDFISSHDLKDFDDCMDVDTDDDENGLMQELQNVKNVKQYHMHMLQWLQDRENELTQSLNRIQQDKNARPCRGGNGKEQATGLGAFGKGQGTGQLSCQQESELAEGSWKINPSLPIRAYLNQYTINPSVPASTDNARTVDVYQIDLPYVIPGLAIIDVDLHFPAFSADKKVGLGLIALQPIPKNTAIGLFTGQYEYMPTYEIIVNAKHNPVYNELQNYSMKFDHLVNEPSLRSGRETKSAAYLECVPRLLWSKDTNDNTLVELATWEADSEHSRKVMYDAMALINEDEENPNVIASAAHYKSGNDGDTVLIRPTIVVSAMRDIQPGEQLLLHYDMVSTKPNESKKDDGVFKRRESKSLFKKNEQESIRAVTKNILNPFLLENGRGKRLEEMHLVDMCFGPEMKYDPKIDYGAEGSLNQFFLKKPKAYLNSTSDNSEIDKFARKLIQENTQTDGS